MVEHRVHITGVAGSSPARCTTVCPKTQFLDGYYVHYSQYCLWRCSALVNKYWTPRCVKFQS